MDFFSMKNIISGDQPLLLLKANAAARYLLMDYMYNYFKLFIVTEHPKSGGTWVAQMISDYFGVPFPRNRMPFLGTQVLHCHRTHLNDLKKAIVVLRDGRDVVVSYYYHSFFYNDLYNRRHVNRIKKQIKFDNYHNIKENLPRFIEFVFSKEKKYPKIDWKNFSLGWYNKDVAMVRYENLLTNCADELGHAIKKMTKKDLDINKLNLIVERYSFKNLSNNQPAQNSETKWLRKGISGDWKNVFSKNAKEIFDKLAGDALITLGYEKDHKWAS